MPRKKMSDQRGAGGPGGRASARRGWERGRRPRPLHQPRMEPTDARRPRRRGTSSDCPGNSARIADLIGERLIGELGKRSPGALAMAPSGPPGPISSRNAAIACSNRRSIRSVKPLNVDLPRPRQVGRLLDDVAVDRLEEHQGADALVEVLRILPERLQVVARREDLAVDGLRRGAGRIGRGSAGRGFDRLDQQATVGRDGSCRTVDTRSSSYRALRLVLSMTRRAWA